MITTAVRTSLSPIYTNPTKISFIITLKCIQNDIFVVYIMSTHIHTSYVAHMAPLLITHGLLSVTDMYELK